MLATISIIDFFQYVQLNDGSIIQIHLMDTAGQEKFNAITENYYQKADCCLLVYDITSRQTFNRVKNYYADKIKYYCNNILKVVLLGNKADLNNKREVSDVEGADLAIENGYTFMESSCVDNYNGSDAFTALVEMTNMEIKKGYKTESFSLNKKEQCQNSDSKKQCSC